MSAPLPAPPQADPPAWWQAALAVADAHEPRLAAALAQALAPPPLDPQLLARLLARRAEGELLPLVAAPFGPALAARLADLLAAAAAQAALTAPRTLAEETGLGGWARRQAARLTRELARQARRAARAVARDARRRPPEIAAALVAGVAGLGERDARAVARFHQRLLDDGQPPATAAARAGEYAARLRQARAATIARTEATRAVTQGLQHGWDDLARRGLLPRSARQQWVVTPDDRLCPACRALRGATAPLGGRFVVAGASVAGPPLHPNCRCTLRLVVTG
jgi:hypothetical protein